MEKTLNCKDCGREFAHNRQPGTRGRNPVYCPECREKKGKKFNQEVGLQPSQETSF